VCANATTIVTIPEYIWALALHGSGPHGIAIRAGGDSTEPFSYFDGVPTGNTISIQLTSPANLMAFSVDPPPSASVTFVIHGDSSASYKVSWSFSGNVFDLDLPSAGSHTVQIAGRWFREI
jgi:hypothetical protein